MWPLFVLIIILHVFISGLRVSMIANTLLASYPFSPISNISPFLNSSNFTSVSFLSIPSIPILVLIESEQGQVMKTCYENFQIHLLVIMYCFARRDHDTCLDLFYFKVFPYAFCQFVISFFNVLHCHVTWEFFLLWEWCSIKSLSTIHVSYS